MRVINTLLGIVLVLLLLVTVAHASTHHSYRYTQRERIKLAAHACTEDEYLMIPARRVNDRVTYHTPDRAMCVAIESVRLAPLG